MTKKKDDKEKKLDRKTFDKELKKLQVELVKLQEWVKHEGLKVVVVFEGRDAAGKGGALNRLVERLDPRSVRVHSITKPTAEELAHHYLWRFWQKFPARGQTAVFDRSWYGRRAWSSAWRASRPWGNGSALMAKSTISSSCSATTGR